MAKFDESKVINALHTDKAEIGKKYYFSDYIGDLKRDVENGTIHAELVCIKVENCNCPFCVKDNNFALLYPYEEPTKGLVPFVYEDFESISGKIIKRKDGRKEKRTIISVREDVDGNIWFGDMSAKSMLEYWVFLDDKPCGKYKE